MGGLLREMGEKAARPNKLVGKDARGKWQRTKQSEQIEKTDAEGAKCSSQNSAKTNGEMDDRRVGPVKKPLLSKIINR